MSVDLLFVIKDFGVGFIGRRNSFAYLNCGLLSGALLTSFILDAGAAVGTLSGLRKFSGFALNFRECCSDEFTVHLIITSKNRRRV